MQNLPVLHFKTHVRVGLQCSCIREPVGWLVSWICGRFSFCLISSRGVVGRGNGHVALPEISQNTSCLIRRAHFLTYPQPFALSLSLWSSFFLELFPNDSLYLAFLLLFSHPLPSSFTFSPICHFFSPFVTLPPSLSFYLLLLSAPLCSNQLEITVQFTEKHTRWKESVWLHNCPQF